MSRTPSMRKRWKRGATAAEIDAHRTPAGGWTKESLALFGVPWPPPKGWRQALIARAERRAQEAT